MSSGDQGADRGLIVAVQAMKLALIWAMAENGVIGRKGTLPWRLPGEMQYFKAATLGKPVIVGRKTFESFPKPLPGRTNIVVSRSARFEHPRVRMAKSLDEAIEIGQEIAARDEVDEVMVAGGAELYALGLPRADRLYMTLVHAEIDGDAVFPAFDESVFGERRRVRVPADVDNAHDYSLVMLERRAKA